MPSDAYMELQDPTVWGETFDEEFGMSSKGRQLGAFEIANFSFDVSNALDDDSDSSDNQRPGNQRPGLQAVGKRAAIKHPTIGHFTINKAVDKASPELFLACCQQTVIDWAIISIRESGELGSGSAPRKPYLVLEFRGVTVEHFEWTLNPGDSSGAPQEEKLQFSFQTILIKYGRQSKEGLHDPMKMKGWDRRVHKPYGSELPPVAQLHG